MKRILAFTLAVLLALSFAACEKEVEPQPQSTLAGKTPKALYDAAIDYVKGLTNYEILIESNYKTSYEDEISEESSKTLHCCTEDTFYYFYESEYYEEFFIHDGTALYQDVNNIREKTEMSFSDFMESWGSVTEDGLLISLDESSFADELFIPYDDVYYLDLRISEEEYSELTGGSVEAPVEYQVYFNEEGNLIRFERSMVYYYEYYEEVMLIEDNIKVSIDNVGSAEKAVAPDDAEDFPVRVLAEDINLSSVESLDAFESASGETDYVLLDIKIDGTVKTSETESVENYQGKILIRLFPDVAPLSVSNFKTLVGSSFYDGIIFHRVIKDFMIQGGDPEGTGQGGSDGTIFGEFSSNGFTNNLSHNRGVVSMARADDPDSASSQFFICHADYPSLDGNYAAFGYIVYGMDAVDVIAGLEVDENDKPVQAVTIEKASFMQKKS